MGSRQIPLRWLNSASAPIHKDQIEVFYLPSCSPELDPNEMANADLKQAVTKLAPARTKLQLVKATARHLSSVQRRPDRLKSNFQHAPVRYALEFNTSVPGQ
jgi:tRNA U34 5-methylaminomethyl-2-thiouridine-forming methyltransferase MnmC